MVVAMPIATAPAAQVVMAAMVVPRDLAAKVVAVAAAVVAVTVEL
jgi:hypothetical protein